MIDIHCHILWDVDDGADDIACSLFMSEVAALNGTTAIIATPHSDLPEFFEDYDPDYDYDYKGQVAALNEELVALELPVKIYPGCEIYGTGDFLKYLKAGKLLTLNDSIYPLIEFDFYEHPASVFAKLQQVVAEGFVPIVAHPERYAFAKEDCKLVERLKSLGCLIQLNKGSITGKFGAESHRCAHEILERGLADFVASDAHRPIKRSPDMGSAFSVVSEMYSKQYANLLFQENPLRVIENKKI